MAGDYRSGVGDAEMASLGPAYYRGGDPAKPVVYEDFLPASAAGIFRSNLDADAEAGEAETIAGYSLRPLPESGTAMTTTQTAPQPTAEQLRTRARDALHAVGSRTELHDAGAHGFPASTPVSGETLFTIAETTPDQADRRDSRSGPGVYHLADHARAGARGVGGAARRAAHRPQGRSGQLVTMEAGKITSEARGEVQEMIDVCEFAVGLSRQLYGRTIASERPGHRLMETWHPLGLVGVITAFNFPVAVWAWNTAVALVCGDTVVWKPSELTPLTALACQALIERAADDVGAPPSVSRLILGGREVGELLVDDPRVALLSATGSVRMGQQVGPRVAQRFGRCFWNWAATTPRSSPRRPTWISRCAASSSRPRARPGNAARRCDG